jgi:fructokinase
MSYKIVGIGEILWDVFPGSKKLGGAPANFAYFVKKLGQDGLIASRVGSDLLGKEILDSLAKLGLDKDYIQIDSIYPTGTVDVRIDNSGQPDYIINENVAWDFLELNEGLKKLAGEADVICFGTLAQRSLKSRATIIDFLKMSRSSIVKILDINLRQNFYSLETIVQSMEFATVLKLSVEELEIIKNLMGYYSEEKSIEVCRDLIDKYSLRLICLTRGEEGSLLVDENSYYDHPGYRVHVSDTVGAGDAFTAAVIIKYLEGSSIEEISNSANRLGSWVCSQAGPTPVLDNKIKEDFMKGI